MGQTHPPVKWIGPTAANMTNERLRPGVSGAARGVRRGQSPQHFAFAREIEKISRFAAILGCRIRCQQVAQGAASGAGKARIVRQGVGTRPETRRQPDGTAFLRRRPARLIGRCRQCGTRIVAGSSDRYPLDRFSQRRADRVLARNWPCRLGAMTPGSQELLEARVETCNGRSLACPRSDSCAVGAHAASADVGVPTRRQRRRRPEVASMAWIRSPDDRGGRSDRPSPCKGVDRQRGQKGAADRRRA